MDLNSGKVITRGGKVTEVPVTTLVIKAVEQMAECQGFKSLKFKNRHGVVFHDTDWIAGVDYEEDNNNNRNKNENENNNNNENVDNDEEYVKENDEYTEYDEDYDLEGDQIDPSEMDDLFNEAKSNRTE